MTIRPRVLAVALLLLTMPLMGVLAATPSDDAGTDGDAPDSPSDALNVSPGRYVGNLTPRADDKVDDYDTYDNNNITEDGDWYRVNASEDREGPACTSAYYEPDDEPYNETRVHLRQPTLNDAHLNATTNSSGTTLSMVGPSASGALAGLSHLDPPRVTQYDLELNVTTLDDVPDHNLGDPNTLDEPCVGGTLGDSAQDVWQFAAEKGDYLFTSLGTETDRMDELVLVDPDGMEVGSIVSEDDIAIGAKTLNETGIWELRVEAGSGDLLSSTDASYTMSWTLLDPGEEEEEERGCSPHCLE